MTFEEVLPAVKAGGRARRKLWAEMDGKVGDWLELVTDAAAGSRPIRPVYMIWYAGTDELVMWGGAHLDMLAEDWELL